MGKNEKVSNADLSSSDIKNQIKCIISNVYDIQKLRVSTGNRLVQSFYIQMGIKPSTSPDDKENAEQKKMIDKIIKEYSRVSDAVAENNVSVKKAIKDLGTGDKPLEIIRSDMDYKLIESYTGLKKSEEDATKVVEKYVQSHPMWDAFFKDIKGCGPLMSGVCLAYLDPYKAKYPSSFFRYCGLDTVQDEDKDGNKLYYEKIDGEVTNCKVREKKVFTYHDTGENYDGKVVYTNDCDSDGKRIIKSSDGKLLDYELAMQGNNKVYEEVETGNEYIGDVVVAQHGRRKGDTEMFEYTDKDGVKKLKRGITYNPFLKTKIMGVLAGSFMRQQEPTYSKIYYDYRARLDNSAKHKNYTDGHKNMMAQHYMMKQFLRNLHTKWREVEGLPIYEPYEVEKLGNRPHHLNEEQYLKAQEWKKKIDFSA